MGRLDESFYRNSAINVAPLLLGKLLCRKIDDEIVKLHITETEIYYGECDTACHAHKGKTNRTKVMYEQGGIAYVYICYGIHNMLNVVTGQKDFPEAVLIRGVEKYDGPGKLTKALKIDRELNGENLISSNRIWLEDDGTVFEYEAGKRIGIAYADKQCQDKLWRFTKTKSLYKTPKI